MGVTAARLPVALKATQPKGVGSGERRIRYQAPCNFFAN
jgi:hypothetical protein